MVSLATQVLIGVGLGLGRFHPSPADDSFTVRSAFVDCRAGWPFLPTSRRLARKGGVVLVLLWTVHGLADATGLSELADGILLQRSARQCGPPQLQGPLRQRHHGR